jgi:hypothetical protein
MTRSVISATAAVHVLAIEADASWAVAPVDFLAASIARTPGRAAQVPAELMALRGIRAIADSRQCEPGVMLGTLIWLHHTGITAERAAPMLKQTAVFAG